MLRRALLLAVASLLALPAAAQVQRAFPATALRGAIVFGQAPDIALNGQPARLAPGARIRDTSNLSVVPGALLGGRYLVNFTVDLYGLVKEVWILTPDEAARQPWPTSIEQAQAWTFDPAAQVWTQP
jgi:hypothetical protein